MTDWIKKINWNNEGLLPVIIQEFESKDVLMFAWMNEKTLRASLKNKTTVLWSRSRQREWMKGEESGHFQKIKSMHLDCDLDVLLIQVVQVGGIACHTGRKSCFFNSIDDKGDMRVDGEIIVDPKNIYGVKNG
ncbi:MAG: phosphoribosyl-AMP cyclohydrolase [Methylophilaceae bacterium]|nr:phosphoribosyl-AMP cyclohydrolase [Methylophilaceae bacterium]MBL6726384.1 phosphoribosyl-AMP cyclohydrolase [Methylophilaceae bacterium]MBL6728514.1 phosphoribosyl-AMP cyclohydrolase [Methylophilaceae bacterium]MBL6790653.1 phosphoribosyl-AMP cyclohydrolase [Methylophilaceae bacterium]